MILKNKIIKVPFSGKVFVLNLKKVRFHNFDEKGEALFSTVQQTHPRDLNLRLESSDLRYEVLFHNQIALYVEK